MEVAALRARQESERFSLPDELSERVAARMGGQDDEAGPASGRKRRRLESGVGLDANFLCSCSRTLQAGWAG